MNATLRFAGSLLAVLLLAGCFGTDESVDDGDENGTTGDGAPPPTGITAPNPYGDDAAPNGTANQTGNETATGSSG